LADIIQEVRPNIVITHSPLENGGVDDHASVGQMTIRAINVAGALRKGGGEPHSVAQVFFVGLFGYTSILNSAHPFFPAILIDITELAERKVKALDKLKTQFYSGSAARKIVECMNGFYGVHARVPYVEVFTYMYPEVHKHLPVNEFSLDRAESPVGETLSKSTRMLAPFVPQE
jgi:LmbE family N-acetylglucosaminyl deacetylase